MQDGRIKSLEQEINRIKSRQDTTDKKLQEEIDATDATFSEIGNDMGEVYQRLPSRPKDITDHRKEDNRRHDDDEF